MFRGYNDDIIPTGLNLQVLLLPIPGIMHLDAMVVYFPNSSGPSPQSTIKSDDNDNEWRIEYQRTIKKIRT